MAKEKQVYTQTFNQGIDSDTADELMSSGAYRYALNIRVLASGEGSQGLVTNVKGNTEISTSLPIGINICIGSKDDTENNKLYYFVYNSLGYHGIYQYNALLNTIQPIITSKQDSGGIDILRFDPKYLILHIDIIDGLLSWVDGLNPARKFNISKALDKSPTGYGLVIKEEYINADKLAPIYAPVLAYFTDPDRLSNYLDRKLFKATVRHGFDDKELSNWSEYSTVPLPEASENIISGASSVSNENNGLKIVVETGSSNVEKIEIAIQHTTPEGASLFESIITLDKARLNISDNGYYEYTFYNDNVSYSGTDQGKIIRAYSFLPDQPTGQAFTKNAMVYMGGKEGFEPVDIDISVEVTYDDLYLSDETETELNDPLFTATDINQWYTPVEGAGETTALKHTRDKQVTLRIGNDVVKDNVFNLLIYNGQRDHLPFTYKANSSDTSTTVAREFIRQLVGTGRVRTVAYEDIPYVDIYNLIYGADYVEFSFVFKGLPFRRLNEPYDEFEASPVAVSNSVLKDNGQSIANHKSGGTVKYGVLYWNEFTKRSSTYTSNEAVVRTDFVTESDGFKRVAHIINIKHQPPIWATHWDLVRTIDLTYGDWIHVLIQQAIESQTTDDTEYIDLVIDSLFTYQRMHPEAVVNYEFTKNDRIRLIKNEEDGILYDFFETVVLDYKTNVEETINEDVFTVDGSADITVGGGVASTDNIGRFISINDIEREITGATGAVYTLSRELSFGSNSTYQNYKIIDKRAILRIKKPIGVTIVDNSLIEAYKPTSNTDSSEKNFYLFGQKYDILNYGTASRSHAGNDQNQDPNDLDGTPAKVIVSKGMSFTRNRELPTNNIIPETQVIIDLVEDKGYSDYYRSDLSDNGKVSPEDTGLGVVKFGDRLRFSNNYIAGTGVNGLSDFDNLDRKDYNDNNGDFKLIVFREGILMSFKALKTGYIPIFATIIQDERSNSLLGASAKLLNEIQYFTYEGGIGNNPESYASNGSWMWFCSANSGSICRTGGDGILPVSEQFKLDTVASDLLSNSAKYGSRIFGSFDRQAGEYQPCFEGYNQYNYNGVFDPTWGLANPALHADTVYEVTTNAINGDVTTDGKFFTYTPDTDYVGEDYFFYRYQEPLGAWSAPKKQCLTVIEPVVIPVTTTYYNAEQSTDFTKSGCGVGSHGTIVPYVVPEFTYSSPFSQAAADQLATDDTNANGQAFADTNGVCVSDGGFTISGAYGMTFTVVSGTDLPTFTLPEVGNQTVPLVSDIPIQTINVTLTGTVGPATKLNLYANEVMIDCVPVPSAGTYGLDLTSVIDELTGSIRISVNSGTC